MTTRKEQMREAAENHPRMRDISGFDDRGLYHCAFKDGAEWADANPQTTGEIVIEAIKNIGQDARSYLLLKSTEAKLAIAVEALKYIGNSIPGPDQKFELENKNAAIQALAKIEALK